MESEDASEHRIFSHDAGSMTLDGLEEGLYHGSPLIEILGTESDDDARSLSASLDTPSSSTETAAPAIQEADKQQEAADLIEYFRGLFTPAAPDTMIQNGEVTRPCPRCWLSGSVSATGPQSHWGSKPRDRRPPEAAVHPVPPLA